MAAEANGSNRIEMQAICKYFTGVKALDNVGCTIATPENHVEVMPEYQ